MLLNTRAKKHLNNLLYFEGARDFEQSRKAQRKYRKLKRQAEKKSITLFQHLTNREKDRTWQLVLENIGNWTLFVQRPYIYRVKILGRKKTNHRARAVEVYVDSTYMIMGPSAPSKWNDGHKKLGTKTCLTIGAFRRKRFHKKPPTKSKTLKEHFNYWYGYCQALHGENQTRGWDRYMEGWQEWIDRVYPDGDKNDSAYVSGAD